MTAGRAAMKSEQEPLSPGVCVAIAFLRGLGIVMILPIIGACLAAMSGLVAGSFESELLAGAFLFSGTALGAFLIMIMLALGSDWLARHLKATAMGPGSIAGVQRPVHPGRQIFLPPLGCVMAYAFLAVLVWLPSTFENPPAQTWPWPVVWSAIGLGAMYLFHLLDEKLP